jgi:hypothetical protein
MAEYVEESADEVTDSDTAVGEYEIGAGVTASPDACTSS